MKIEEGLDARLTECKKLPSKQRAQAKQLVTGMEDCHQPIKTLEHFEMSRCEPRSMSNRKRRPKNQQALMKRMASLEKSGSDESQDREEIDRSLQAVPPTKTKLAPNQSVSYAAPREDAPGDPEQKEDSVGKEQPFNDAGNGEN